MPGLPSDFGVSGASAMPAAAPAIIRCQNCGATITAKYCATCGQRHEPEVHSLWHFAREATENITHADSRLWATLGRLLFRPGQLTRDFFDGRRARFLPPFRLYLVISLVFFLLAGGETGGSKAIIIDAKDGATSGAARCTGIQYDGPAKDWLLPRLLSACKKMTADGGKQLSREFVHNVPRSMFAFLPLLAALMMLLYWRPRRYYVEHLLFFIHNHACIFLAMAAHQLLSLLAWKLPANILGIALFFYIPWYLFRSARCLWSESHADQLEICRAGSLLFAARQYHAADYGALQCLAALD